MGQKVNPEGLRVGVIKDWKSNWYAGKSDFPALIKEDYDIRKTIKTDLYDAGISKITIERTMGRIRVTINTAKPGVIIGKNGASVEELRKKLQKQTGKTVLINVEEIRNQDLDAQLVAEHIAADIEGRTSFRRAMKQAIQRTMRAGAEGMKVSCKGRLAGSDMARTEHYAEGKVPAQTLRADIEYGFATARTQYGAIGVKVWIYLGEILPGQDAPEPKRRNNHRDNHNRNDHDRNNRGGRRNNDRYHDRDNSRNSRGRQNRNNRGQRNDHRNQASGSN